VQEDFSKVFDQWLPESEFFNKHQTNSFFFGSLVSRHAALAAKSGVSFVWCYSYELGSDEMAMTKQIIAEHPELRP